MRRTGVRLSSVLAKLHPDVIVLDLRMPEHEGMEGLDLCRGNLSETKILVLTANVNPDNLRDAMTAGAAGYLTKQTSGKELCRAVITVHRGGSVVPPTPAVKMPDETSPKAAGDLPRHPSLSARERSIVRLLSRGLTDNRSPATVRLTAHRAVRPRECPEEDRPVGPCGDRQVGNNSLDLLIASAARRQRESTSDRVAGSRLHGDHRCHRR